MDDQCARVKELEKVDQTSMYDEVKKKPNNNIATKKKDGTVCYGRGGSQERWSEHISELFEYERGTRNTSGVEDPSYNEE